MSRDDFFPGKAVLNAIKKKVVDIFLDKKKKELSW